MSLCKAMSAKVNRKNQHSDEPAGHRRRWPFLCGAAVIALGVAALAYRHWGQDHGPVAPLQAVLPDLTPAIRMVAEPGSLKDWNVLLISLDTTRADHLNCYGYAGTKTRTLNRLARQGVLYGQAYTPAATTLAAHSSLMTGLYPLHHGVRANMGFRLEDRYVTLGETLRGAGYRTGAAISAFVLDSQFGIDQGFETYDDDLTKGVQLADQHVRERRAEQTNVDAKGWLREHGREKFFYWVHYFDPHDPYVPPEPYRTEYAQAPYDGEIDYADQQIGHLLDVLDEIGVRQQTLVVFVTDHGEGLGQHGEEVHGVLMYDSTMHVGMIISAPSPFPQGQVVHDQVSLVDVMPTVLELLGVPIPDGLDGISLLGEVRTARSAIYMETLHPTFFHGWAPLIGIRQGDYKYILAPQRELYDLRHDRGEEINLHEAQPEVANQCFRTLLDFVGAEDPYVAALAAQNLPADEETRRKLASLGYVGGGGDVDQSPESLPDPKEMIYNLETIKQADLLMMAGRVKEAIDAYEGVLKLTPRDSSIRQSLSDCYRIIGQLDRALQVIDAGLEHDPDHWKLLCAKGALLVNAKRPDDAREIYQRLHQHNPEDAMVGFHLGRIDYLQGNVEEALARLEEAARRNPGTVGPLAYNHIGGIHLDAGRTEEARQAFQAALQIDAHNAPAHAGLASVLLAEGQRDDAMRHLHSALEFSPAAVPAMVRLAECYREKGDLQQAADFCQQALAIHSRHVRALLILALTCREQGKIELGKQHYRQATSELKQVLVKDPNNAQVRQQLADFSEAWRLSPAETIQLYTAILANDVDNALALRGRAEAHLRLGRHAQAIADFEQALTLREDDESILNNLAWILATSPDDSLRDGQRAIELAGKACTLTGHQQAPLLSTLAAAYAEAGEFDKAISSAEKALEAADRTKNEPLKNEIDQNLKLYRNHQPFRQTN